MAKHHAQGRRMVTNTQHDISINKIKRAPAFRYTIIPCSDCGAEVGKWCVTTSGQRNSHAHISRKRLALQKLLDEVETV